MVVLWVKEWQVLTLIMIWILQFALNKVLTKNPHPRIVCAVISQAKKARKK